MMGDVENPDRDPDGEAYDRLKKHLSGRKKNVNVVLLLSKLHKLNVHDKINLTYGDDVVNQEGLTHIIMREVIAAADKFAAFISLFDGFDAEQVFRSLAYQDKNGDTCLHLAARLGFSQHRAILTFFSTQLANWPGDIKPPTAILGHYMSDEPPSITTDQLTRVHGSCVAAWEMLDKPADFSFPEGSQELIPAQATQASAPILKLIRNNERRTPFFIAHAKGHYYEARLLDIPEGCVLRVAPSPHADKLQFFLYGNGIAHDGVASCLDVYGQAAEERHEIEREATAEIFNGWSIASLSLALINTVVGTVFDSNDSWSHDADVGFSWAMLVLFFIEMVISVIGVGQSYLERNRALSDLTNYHNRSNRLWVMAAVFGAVLGGVLEGIGLLDEPGPTLSADTHQITMSVFRNFAPFLTSALFGSIQMKLESEAQNYKMQRLKIGDGKL